MMKLTQRVKKRLLKWLMETTDSTEDGRNSQPSATSSESSRAIRSERDYIEKVNGNVYTAPVTIQQQGDSAEETDPAVLQEIYLRRLLETCSQIFLGGIDRKASGQDTETRLNLCEIYTALLTRQAVADEQHRMTPERTSRERRLSAVEQVDRHQRLVLLGDPGSGKSTFVNFVAMCLAGEFLKDPYANVERMTAPLPDEEGEDAEERQKWTLGRLLPLRVILRDFAVEGLPDEGESANGGHLWDFIAGRLQEMPFGDYAPFLQKQLQDEGGLVLLDGLDEVPEAHRRREQLKQAVEDFAHCFPKCRIVVTSRIYAYQKQEWQLSGFREAVLASFSKGQIQRFVNRWYLHSAPLLGIRPEDADTRAERLKRVILTNRNLYELAERPLLLTLMASLHAWRGGSLPEKREELYNDAVELLLDWWESRKVKHLEGHELSLTEVLHLGREGMQGLRRLMERLAYDAHASQAELVGTANIPEDTLAGGLMRLSAQQGQGNPLEFVSYLRDRAGLLVPHGNGVYTFPHRTFQEYLAACHLTEDQNNYPANIAGLGRQEPNRWREVVLLAGAKAARGAASTIWQLVECLCWRDRASSEDELADSWGALLAGQALVDVADLSQLNPPNQVKVDRIRDWLTAILREQPFDSAQGKPTPFPIVERALAGNILAKLGDPRPGVGLREDGFPDIEWCEVPAGTFTMGSESFSDAPPHRVTVSAFQMSRFPVTNAQYQAFVDDGGYTVKWRECWEKDAWKWKEQEAQDGPAKRGGEFDLANHPVVTVSWYEAQAYCRWLTRRLRECGELSNEQEIRLPTEAEWEKAARGTDGRAFPWGNDEITPELANYGQTELSVTSAVGCFPRGKSPHGCGEMTGNVWEWCLDSCDRDKQYNLITDTYKDGLVDPLCSRGSNRVRRGGAWSIGAVYCRTASRHDWHPASRSGYVGFRLLRTPL